MTDETTARHCEACGQVRVPDDYWQRKITYWQDLAVANRKVAEEAQSQRDKAREDALEEAAKVCEPQSDHDDPLTAHRIAAAIRAMKKECGK